MILFRISSVVEQLTVNQLVVGSNPTSGDSKALLRFLKSAFFLKISCSDAVRNLGIVAFMNNVKRKKVLTN